MADPTQVPPPRRNTPNGIVERDILATLAKLRDRPLPETPIDAPRWWYLIRRIVRRLTS